MCTDEFSKRIPWLIQRFCEGLRVAQKFRRPMNLAERHSCGARSDSDLPVGLTRCSSRAQMQGRARGDFPRLSLERFCGWAKEVSNHRPPACKVRPEHSGSDWLLHISPYRQGVTHSVFQPAQAHFSLFSGLMFAKSLPELSPEMGAGPVRRVHQVKIHPTERLTGAR